MHRKPAVAGIVSYALLLCVNVGREPNKKPPEGGSLCGPRALQFDQATVTADPFCFQRCAGKPSPQKPRIIIAQIEGSGTAEMETCREPPANVYLRESLVSGGKMV
jgi:hypothetical protein